LGSISDGPTAFQTLIRVRGWDAPGSLRRTTRLVSRFRCQVRTEVPEPAVLPGGGEQARARSRSRAGEGCPSEANHRWEAPASPTRTRPSPPRARPLAAVTIAPPRCTAGPRRDCSHTSLHRARGSRHVAHSQTRGEDQPASPHSCRRRTAQPAARKGTRPWSDSAAEWSRLRGAPLGFVNPWGRLRVVEGAVAEPIVKSTSARRLEVTTCQPAAPNMRCSRSAAMPGTTGPGTAEWDR
jgi:hypothetical protein